MFDGSVVRHISVHPGQIFRIMAVGLGVGISPAVVRSRIIGKYDIFPELQSLGIACEPLNYTLLAPGNISGIRVRLTVEGTYSNIKLLNITTLKALFCNSFNISAIQCCSKHLSSVTSTLRDSQDQALCGLAWGLMRRDSSLTCTVLMHTANCKRLTSNSLVLMYSVALVTLEFFVEVVSMV